jgi:hypothetical protein
MAQKFRPNGTNGCEAAMADDGSVASKIYCFFVTVAAASKLSLSHTLGEAIFFFWFGVSILDCRVLQCERLVHLPPRAH